MSILRCVVQELFSLSKARSNTISGIVRKHQCSKIHTCRILANPRRIPTIRTLDVETVESKEELESKGPLAVSPKYKIFRDSDASIIGDTLDENVLEQEDIEDDFDEFDGINVNRGVTGVYDIEELVEILKRENARDIFVVSVPDSCRFVDYICVVTGRTPRHILAMAEFIRKLFKRKCSKADHIPNLEGKNTKDWMALDLGNIALHIFSPQKRETYDIEQLWAVGPEFDSECVKNDDDIVTLMERHSIYLHDLKPADK